MRQVAALLAVAIALAAGVGAAPATAQEPDTACTVPVPAAAPELDEKATAVRDRTHRIATGAGVQVAVIDTGVAPHEQLITVAPGADFVAPGTPNALFDCDGHGTAVAGIIAGREVGVAPAAGIISVRQTSAHYRSPGPNGGAEAAGTLASLAQAMHSALDLDADVINVSVVACVPAHLAQQLDTAALREALARAEAEDVVVVAAAGNVTAECLPGDVVYPAHAPTVLAVGARAGAHEMAEYSLPVPEQTGELSAPGRVPVALAAGGTGWAQGTRAAGGDPVRGPVTGFEGSSFAAPVVSGTAALLRERYPADSAAQLRERIVQAARPAHGLVLPYETLTHVPASFRRTGRELTVSAPTRGSTETTGRVATVLGGLAAVVAVGCATAGIRRGAGSGSGPANPRREG